MESLARQSGDIRFEVIVGLDGPDDESMRAALAAWNPQRTDRELRVIEYPRAGYTEVRNRLVDEARGRVMLSLNDDVIADPELVSMHWREHEARRREGRRPAIVVGSAPYLRRPRGELDSMLDRLVRETGVVFFYDVMNTPDALRDREKDWGYRHCFGLNFSADTQSVRTVGKFLARRHVYGYDDIELGYKLSTRLAMPVLYRPEALVMHDHFYTAHTLLERERALGRAAWVFAEAHPEFAAAVFSRDIRSHAEIAYSKEFLHRERSAAERGAATLAALEQVPSDAVDGSHAGPLIRALYEQHLLVKRWTWRSGLLEAAGESAT